MLVDYEISDPINDIKDANVKKKLNIKELGVPLIIIGNEYFLGYSETYDYDIISSITKNCKSSNYADIVNPLN